MTEPYSPLDGQPPPTYPNAPPSYPTAPGPPGAPGPAGYQGPPPYPANAPGYPGYAAYTPLPPYNTYAILSLVFAIAIFPPLGIYFGAKAKQQIAVSGERGVELAKAGYIVGWVLSSIYVGFLVIWCAFAIFFLGIFGMGFGAAATGGGL